MNIKGSTNIVGLIGHPVEHSFSPPMHNAAFEELGMDWAYVAFDVDPNNLKLAIDGAKSLNIKGFNVTIPHKINVMDYLDEIDEVAGLIGAVNTIDFSSMKGYNTDGIGAVKAIEEVTSIKNSNVVVAGAGGASRAISFYIVKYGADSLTILNRNIQKAQDLAGDVEGSDLIDEVGADSISNINSYLDDADILIDTTPLGMHPHIDDEPVAIANNMHEDLTVFDAVYNPNETVLLKEAIKAGAKPVYGIKMLLYQGAESFEIWTGKKAPVDVMEEALRKTLNLE
ncbi:MAG: shikimate dehydrogenase [Methanobrevibacter thaueri]|jgi:shikimate dehydrogenase|uniref:shikimate dehydrogenase n=1 Tax=Methanobrevibacter thaueri TaxID=190975 RepID=UPI0026EC8C64|nr:shikimate dehydrogenase [Methanobrevibacter thaueri]MBE6496450.1 shikimate dehydrogenase [Methanobrevibacter thaueri]